MAKRMNRRDFIAMIDTSKEYRIEELMELWECTRDCARGRVLASLLTSNPIAVNYGKHGGRRYNPRKKGDFVLKQFLGDCRLQECPNCKKLGNVGDAGQPVHYILEDGFIFCPNCAHEPESVR